MDPIEKAIRNAFAKGDPRDPGFREKVYRSAFAALERALQANPGTTVARAIAKRKELESRIGEIESAFAAPGPAPAVSVGLDDDGPRGAAPAVDISRDTRGSPGPGSRAEPSLDDAVVPVVAFEQAAEGGDLAAADPDRVRKARGSGRAAKVAMLLVVLIALALGGWWLAGAGLPGLVGAPDGTPPRTVEDELAGEEPGAGGPLSSAVETRDWIAVFKPDDTSSVSVSGGEAQVGDTEGIPFLRVRAGADGEPVRFAVAREVLEQLRGRKAVFDVVARTEDGTETQAAVSCDFGGFGACNRKRYAVTDAARADFLFDVEFPDEAPKGGGTIALDPDVTGGGKAIDVYEIRVSASN